jgi:hypothetical protein
MTFSVWTLVLAVFLSGAAAGVFVMLVIGIRRGDRARHLADEPGTHLDALTRSVLGVGVRTTGPASDDRAEGA